MHKIPLSVVTAYKGVPALLVILVTFLCFGAQIGFTRNGPTCTTLPNGHDLCRIDRPNVTQYLTEYPQVKFKPGDLVTVRAGGCVNTHGGGKTSKDYVRPLGANSDQLYHGLIVIPGGLSAQSES